MSHHSVESRQATRDVPTPPVVVTQTTAARLSGLSRRQIENLVHAGQLASLQCGARRMVTRYSLDALIRQLHGQHPA
jgi:hypothetical protein